MSTYFKIPLLQHLVQRWFAQLGGATLGAVPLGSPPHNVSHLLVTAPRAALTYPWSPRGGRWAQQGGRTCEEAQGDEASPPARVCCTRIQPSPHHGLFFRDGTSSARWPAASQPPA